MVTYGPWETYTGLRQSAVIAPDWFRAIYATEATDGGIFANSNTWAVVQSFDAHLNNQLPHTYESARVCCLIHAAEGNDGFEGGWDPGECAAVNPPVLGAAVALGADSDPVPVGTVSGWQGPPLYLLPATFRCQVIHSGGTCSYVPLWYSLGAPPDGGALEIHASILAQIPGFVDEVNARRPPEAEKLRIDGEARLEVQVPQTRLTNGITVSAHPTVAGPMTPVSALGAAAMSVPATLGASSGTVTFPDMQPGDVHRYEFASSRVLASADPPVLGTDIADVTWVTDFVWQIRVRFQLDRVLDVCRWRQRDDGLGVTAASRARTGTSLQRGKRHRGYR